MNYHTKMLTKEEIGILRQTLKAVSPHYPGFLPAEMARNIDALCDMALASVPAEGAFDAAELRRFAKKFRASKVYPRRTAWLRGLWCRVVGHDWPLLPDQATTSCRRCWAWGIVDYEQQQPQGGQRERG